MATVFCIAGALMASCVADAAAQCRLDVRPIAGALGYRERNGERCEGMYVELQSAPLNLRVISLLRGAPLDSTLDDESVLVLTLPDHELLTDHALEARIGIVAQPREAGLNWALDAWTIGRDTFRWNLDDVFRKTQISLAQVGISGRTKRTSGAQDEVYVPVALVRSGASAGSSTVHLVFHLPGAGSARICIVTTSTCTGTLEPVRTGGYFDGYFEAELNFSEGPAEGIVPLAVQWRRVDGTGGIGLDRLDIFRW